MSKYYEAESVRTLINSLKCYGIPKLNLDGLPTIKVEEDCLSKAAVLSIISDCQDIEDKAKYNTLAEVFNKVLDAPSVIPKQFTGEPQTENIKVTCDMVGSKKEIEYQLPKCEKCINYGVEFTEDDSIDTCLIDECRYEPKDEPTTQIETQNSNLTFEIADTPKAEVNEDCISREWVLEEFQKGKEKISKSECFDELMWLVKHAPSVVPTADILSAVEDCISREWIYDALLEYGFTAPDMTVTELIEETPSVVPTVRKNRTTAEPQKIGYCNECKWFRDKQVCGRCRSKNLYAPKDEPQGVTTEQSSKVGEWIACTKEGLPLTELGRKERQKWYGYKCSKCNFIYKGNALTESPFCQTCGAKMRLE